MIGSTTKHNLRVHDAWGYLAHGFENIADIGNHIPKSRNPPVLLLKFTELIQKIVSREFITQTISEQFLQRLFPDLRNIRTKQIIQGH